MSEAPVEYEEIDPLVNPHLVNSLSEQALADPSGPASPPPIIRDPQDGFVTMPGGLEVNGKIVTEVEIQELNGGHEEKISRARTSSDPGKFISTILQCGIVAIGDSDDFDVDDLLVGDRDFLLLAIRKATYGSEIEFGEQECPVCFQTFDMVGDLEAVPVKSLGKNDEREFEVPLRKGGSATVRLANGADQKVFMEDPDLTLAERNTLLLSRVISYITFPNGQVEDVVALPRLVRDLGIVDRQNILNAISERQPGPRYDEFSVEHDCGTKVSAPVGLVSLFPGL